MLLPLLTSCGTYSVLRPADNLRAGQFELVGGAALNSIPEVLPAVRFSAGLDNTLEVGLQYEVYTLLAELRFAALRSEDDDFALAIGLQGGLLDRLNAGRINSGSLTSNIGTAMGLTVTMGRRWERWELYFGAKGLTDFIDVVGTLSARLGGRYTLESKYFVGLEAGGSIHSWAGATGGMAEGTLYGGFVF